MAPLPSLNDEITFHTSSSRYGSRHSTLLPYLLRDDFDIGWDGKRRSKEGVPH